MINFRLREEDIPKLDAAARTAGMTRSDFIRRAITELVARYTRHEEPLEAASGRGPAAEKPSKRQPFSDCPRNKACKLQKLPTGIKLCGTCGVKIA
jgi:Arc/MetJ-type ribon-helix-helix transcriptional regulator